jgi:choline-sulfatase
MFRCRNRESMPDQPNVLFVMADQYRGDCVGADPQCPTGPRGHPLVHTPTLNDLASDGTLFERAYTPSPVCVPARRCLWTGQTPATNGCLAGNTSEPWDFAHTLPGELAAAGYQTHLAGKSHSMPLERGNRHRTDFGFDGMDLHVGASVYEDDYSHWVRERREDDQRAHGLSHGDWDARPWHLDEEEHPTNWTTRRALEFLARRDERRPFFLTVSYVRPHPPFDPPRAYWEQYADSPADLPAPAMGDWVDDLYGDEIPGYPETDWLADLPDDRIRRARAAYYGLVTHIDAQIHRLLYALQWVHDALEDTVVVFTADHGEMLGDHHHWTKRYPYEGSARVPLLVALPDDLEPAGDPPDRVDAPVGLEDLMPTLLDLAGVETPDTVEGRSLRPWLRGEAPTEAWRDYYHGELGPYEADNLVANQFLVGEETKYVWFPATGEELLFDLGADPREERNLADDPAHEDALGTWRERLVDRLWDRPEGFVADGALAPVSASD